MSNSTAYLRPLMTKKFTFDFPSYFSTKEISDYNQRDFQTTIKDSNQLMKNIMKGSESFWYIKTRQQNSRIVGKLKLSYQDLQQTQASLDLQLVDNLSSADITEISLRIKNLLVDNLKLTKITLLSPINGILKKNLDQYYQISTDQLNYTKR